MDDRDNSLRFMKRDKVAELFDVDPATVSRWARLGRLGDAVTRTPGGQWRYKEDEIRKLAEPYQRCSEFSSLADD